MAIDSFTGRFAFLSNFHPSPIPVHGRPAFVAPTVEHAYQAAKVEYSDEPDPGLYAQILQAPTPGAAKRLGRRVQLDPPGIKSWNTARVDVMANLLEKKFRPGSTLATLLLETGEEELIEGNWWGDRFWGVCKGDGENLLGELLVAQRGHLQWFGLGGAVY